jgi:molecular chaperone GrpE
MAARQREMDHARQAAEQARQAAERVRRQGAIAEAKQHLQERARTTREGSERIRQSLSGLVTGYNMSVQRIERALRQHGLEPILALGQPFDPERMEVLEAVTGTGRPAGEVVEEVRRGYLWNGRVFRFAQVRVARN